MSIQSLQVDRYDLGDHGKQIRIKYRGNAEAIEALITNACETDNISIMSISHQDGITTIDCLIFTKLSTKECYNAIMQAGG